MEFLPSINRNAYLIKPKGPFLEWCHYINPEFDPGEPVEGHIYLVNETETPEEASEWLQKNFDSIFTHELADWDPDGEDWPKERTFEKFQNWFEAGFHSLIFDLSKRKLVQEKPWEE